MDVSKPDEVSDGDDVLCDAPSGACGSSRAWPRTPLRPKGKGKGKGKAKVGVAIEPCADFFSVI